VIDFQTRNKPAYTNTVRRMTVRDDYDLRRVKRKTKLSDEKGYLVTSANEGSAEHVDVVLDSPNVWVKEVGDHTGF
jgi:hypothetical protein